MNGKHNLGKFLRIILITSVFSFTTFTGLTAEENKPSSIRNETEPNTSITAIDVSTFTLVSTPLPSRNLQLDVQPLLKTSQLQIKTDASKFFQQQLKRDKFENTLFNTSLISLMALNVADYFSTREALKHEGLVEGNPIMKPFVKSDIAFAAVKLGLTLGNHYFMKKLYKRSKAMAWVLSAAANFAMSYIVANNIRLIRSVGN